MRKIQVALSCIMAILILSAIPASAVEVGQKAPDFELPSTKGGKLKLSTFQGKKSVLIEFYVLDFTPT
jgi:peroxiredoxin